jgi:hypothetical protein
VGCSNAGAALLEGRCFDFAVRWLTAKSMLVLFVAVAQQLDALFVIVRKVVVGVL